MTLQPQEVAAPAADPLETVADDYVLGQVHVVFDQVRDGPPRLLFAVVELLPPDAEPGPEIEHSHRLAGSRRLHRWRVHLPPADALRWYRSCRNGDAVLPGTDTALALEPLADEPPWPQLVAEDVERPTWGSETSGVQRHWLLGSRGDELIADWSDGERGKALKALGRELPVDLFARPAWWGSVQLVLPNPLFRDVWMRLGADDREVLVRLVPHPGREVRGVSVILYELGPYGVTTVLQASYSEPFAVFRLPHRPARVALAIACPRRGLLYSEQPHWFFGSVTVTSYSVAAPRVVEVPKTDGARQLYTTEIVLPDSGPRRQPAPTARDVALKDARVQQQRRRAAAAGQQWYEGDDKTAESWLRDIVGKASQRVLIVDPYFGAREFVRFGLANGQPDVVVRMLTGKKHLKSKPPGVEREPGQQLHEQLVSWRAEDPRLQCEIRVMSGARIHDRFVLVDESLWTLGSSLNSFGSRGTVRVLLPDPESITRELEQAWEAATSLEAFAERRYESDPAEPDSGGGDA